MANKLKIRVPASANDITLMEYQEYLRGFDAVKDDNIAFEKHVLSSFCDLDVRVIDELTGNQITEIVTHLLPIISRTEWPLIREFTLNGTDFGFIPDLEESTYGEWVNIDENITNVDNFHKLMAIVFRPVTESLYDKKLKANRYQIVDYKSTKQYSEAMKLIPLDVALGGLHFFECLGIELLRAIPSYLETQMATTKLQQHLETLDKNGNGLGLRINSLTETLRELTK